MVSQGREAMFRSRWPWIVLVTPLSVTVLLVVGCRTEHHVPTLKSTSIGLASAQNPSLDELATAVARVLDDRQRNLPAPTGQIESAAAKGPVQPPSSPEHAVSLQPNDAPATVDVNRLSVDELSSVIAQILREKKLVEFEDARATTERLPSPVQTAVTPVVRPGAVPAPEPVQTAPPPEAASVKDLSAAVSSQKPPATDRAERVAALVARILSAQHADAPEEQLAAATEGPASRVKPAVRATPAVTAPALGPTPPDPAPPPAAPTGAVSEAQVARIVSRVLQEQRRAAPLPAPELRATVPALNSSQPASGASSPPCASDPSSVSPAPPKSASAASTPPEPTPSFDELVRAVERVLREADQQRPRIEPPRVEGLAPAGAPSSWSPPPAGSLIAQLFAPKVVVRMQSSSLSTDEPPSPSPPAASVTLVRRLNPSASQVADEDLARAIAFALKSRVQRNHHQTAADDGRKRSTTGRAAPSTAVPALADSAAPAAFASTEAAFPPPDRPPKPIEVRASPQRIDELAHQIALVLKARVNARGAPSERGELLPAPSGTLGGLDNGLPFVVADTRAPAKSTAPGGAIAEGEAIAASVGGDAFAFSNPFAASQTNAPAPCTSCGRAHPGGSALDDGTCIECGQVPCQGPECYPFPAQTAVGRYLAELYRSICCPDPCYRPEWLPLANSAFFVDGIRPVTQMRIRYNYMNNLNAPDRSEYFWARANGQGPGPTPLVGPATTFRHGKGDRLLTNFFLPSVNVNQVSLYTEAANAAGTLSVFTEIPYQSVQSSFYPFAAGFGTMNVGTKSILFDSKPLQIAFQFRTYIPLGPTSEGLGNGHVSLEPSLIAALRLSDRSYLQAQLAEWIPLGGTPDWQGSMLDYHFSLNHQLWAINPDIPLIGTFEFNGWSFQTGGSSAFARGTGANGATQLFTDRLSSSGSSYFSLALGLRLVVCRAVDFGVAVAFPLDIPNWADPQVLTEFRWRF
jgi:hypothetical protein